MIRPEVVIQEIASDNSKLHKEAVLVREATANNYELFHGLRLCYHPTTTFGVKIVPEHEGPDGPGLNSEDFHTVAGLLASRQLTGHDARDTILDMMHTATVDEWNGWYRRILIKDMRAGFSESTVNKAAKAAKKPAYSIPLFECQLAHDANNHESKLKGKKILDYKLDGVRVLAVIHSGRITLHSRNGRIFQNFPHIEEQINSVVNELEGDWVLDGEITSSSFQELMTQVHRKTDADASDAIYSLFDALPLDAFWTGKYDKGQLERREDLRDLMGHFRAAGCENIQCLDYKEADLDTEEGQELMSSMRARAKELGLEGIMVKDANAPYECKRTTAWLKIKPVIEVSLNVIGAEAGTGKFERSLGALICEGEDDGKVINVNVGSGFSDALRESIWGDLQSVIGSVVEIRADAVTQNQDGTYSLRFPRFKGFRGFEIGEKI